MTQANPFNNLSLNFDSVEFESALWFKKPIKAVTQGEAVRDALAMIHESKSNKIRCVLTGAPYAEIDANQIRASVNAFQSANPSATADDLVDSWDLSLFSLCSQAAPTLRNKNQFSLRELSSLPDGIEQVMTYLLGKLFNVVRKQVRAHKSDSLVVRMHFTQATYEALTQIEDEVLKKMAVRLALLDGWLGFEHWLRLSIMRGTAKAVETFRIEDHKVLRDYMVNPESIEINESSLEEIIQSMQTIMIQTEVSFPGEAAGIASSTQESINVAKAVAAALGVEPVAVRMEHKPSHSEQEAEYIAYRDAITGNPIKVAWSATHGKGHIAGSKGPAPRVAAKADKAPKAAKESNGRATRAVTAKGKERAKLKESLASLISGMNFKL